MSVSRSNSLRLLPSLCLTALLAFGGEVQAAEPTSAPAALLTESGADRIAEAEAAALAKRRADRKRSIESVPAEREWELEQGERKIVFRRVSPPEQALAPKRPTAPVPERRFSDAEIEGLAEDRPAPVFVGFHATVYLDSGSVLGSEVTLRDKLETARYNAARLREARREQREARPPQPEDEVINFYPLSERREKR